MPFDRPTLTSLRQQASADLATALPGSDALLRYSNLGVLADILAAQANGLYGYLDWIALQAVPFTATGEYLEGWAGLKNIFREPAVAAVVPCTFNGTAGTIPLGTLIVRSDGASFTTTSAGSIVAGAVTVPAQANTPGAAGNTAAGVSMTLGVAIGGINSGGVAGVATVLGVDVEDDESLRSRMLQTYQNPPQGGDASDYVTWALTVPGVTRAWSAPLENGAGTVSVYTMFDVAEAAHGGFPQGANGGATAETRITAATGDQLAVANAIYPLRPVTALVYSKAPGNNACVFTINGLSGASAATKAAINAAISVTFLALASPGGVVQLSYIEAAIASVTGSAGFVITGITCSNGTVSPGTSGNITASAGYLSTWSSTTFT